MPYLFQISLGPVQSFIADARRTRDLKFGSWFLSETARVAALALSQGHTACQLIFPALTIQELEQPEESLNVPNKILAYLREELSPTDLKKLAMGVKDKIDERIVEMRDKVFGSIEEKLDYSRAKLQIADLVEYTWAAVEYDDRQAEISYDKARRMLEALMAARKNTRDFAEVTWGGSEPKSSLNGQLECVIPKRAYPPPWNYVLDAPSEEEREKRKEEYKQKSTYLRLYFDAGPHEKLSGVDLLKRLGMMTETSTISTEDARSRSAFPSTSHMAALPFLSGLNKLPTSAQQDVRQKRDTYVAALLDIRKIIPSFHLDMLPRSYQKQAFDSKVFSLGEYDGALLYPERFPDVVGDAQVFQTASKDFQDAIDILKKLCDQIQLFPTAYYVLLAADGDFMGKVIDAQAKKPDGMQRHKDLSAALAKFAGEVNEIIKERAGVRIYSGGDDVLAMLPLHTAVECSRQLSQQFKAALKVFTNEEGRSPTLSVGLAVVHHLHPLGDALRIAREAEGRAKSGEKDALAITVQKRGGPPCTVSGRWGMFDQRLELLVKLCASEIIPSGMAYELEEIVLRLEPGRERVAEPAVSPPHVQYAALRVFQRKLDEARRRGHSENDTASTLRLLKEMIGLEQIQPVIVGELADELVVARLFADARRLAAGRSKGADEA